MNVQGGDQSVHTSWTNTPIMIWMSRALFNSVCVEIVRAGRIDNGFRPADLGTRHAGPLLCERMPYIPPTFARPLSRVHRPWRAHPPSAPHRLRSNASGRCLRRGLATAQPTRSGTDSTFCAVLRSVCGAFLSGWGLGTLTGSTTGQPVRTARHLAPRSTTTRKPQLRGHGGGWVAPPTSHPLRLVPSAIGWACRPARRTCDPWVQYRIAAYRYTLYHTDDIMRKATRFSSRPRIKAPGFAPAQPEPLDAPLLPFARRQTAVPLYILWFRLPAPASSPEVTKLEERLEKPPPPLFGVRRGPFCHAPLRS